MYTIISILILITCALLILIVLVQNSKGGGLSSQFASNNQIVGVRKTADFLEKATWALAIALMLFSLISTTAIDRGNGGDVQLDIQENIDEAQTEPAPMIPQVPQ